MPPEPHLSDPKDTECELEGRESGCPETLRGLTEQDPPAHPQAGLGHTLELSSAIFETSELDSKSGSFQPPNTTEELRKCDHWQKNKIPSHLEKLKLTWGGSLNVLTSSPPR